MVPNPTRRIDWRSRVEITSGERQPLGAGIEKHQCNSLLGEEVKRFIVRTNYKWRVYEPTFNARSIDSKSSPGTV
jgi:hypothetical protein